MERKRDMGLVRYLRTQWRDRKPSFIGTTIGTASAVGVAVATVMTGGVAAPAFIFAAIPFVMGMTYPNSRVTGNRIEKDGVYITGDNRALESIKKMQDFIDEKVETLLHLQDLPPHVEKSILRHLSDLQPLLKDVRCNDCKTGEVVPNSLVFVRARIDAKGKPERVPLATVTPDSIILPGRWVALGDDVVRDATPKALPAPNAVSPDFTRLSQDVRALQEKVAAIENPAPARLDKPQPDKRGL